MKGIGNMKKSQQISRRKFLAITGVVISAPYIVPHNVFSAQQRNGANDRLSVALIGVGGMGTQHLGMLKRFREKGEINIAAVCDVDERMLKKAVKSAGPGVTPYRDYRYILDRKDIDAVVIATPDHWHPVLMVHACQAGKHVNVEKPTSVLIDDGKAMVDAVKRYNTVVQVGSQGRSAKPAYHACAYVRNGMLGEVKKVTCWHRLNPTGGTKPDSAPPPELDWDMWLGPMRWRPHNNSYRTFRWVMASGGGQIRDRGAHMFSVIRWCMDSDKQAPVTVEAKGTPPVKGLWDCPPEMEIVFTFKNPDWQVIWGQPGERETNYPDKNHDFGIVFHGDKDKLIVDRDGTRYEAAEKARNFKVPSGGVDPHQETKYGDDYNMNHKEDWFQAIKTGKKPIMDIEAGHQAATMCILGNLSYLLGRKLHWDSKKQKCIGDEHANRLLSQPQRHPYHL